MWDKDLHGELSFPLGDGKGELRYLPADEVKRLELRRLDYREDVLLFRQAYVTVVESLNLGSSAGGEPSVVVIGQPGIGLYYLLIVATLLTTISRMPT